MKTKKFLVANFPAPFGPRRQKNLFVRQPQSANRK